MAQASSSAETPNDAASTTSALAGPITRDQATGERGAEHRRRCVRPSSEPGDALHRHAGVAASVGVIAAFAASPGPRRAPATATRPRKPGNDSSPASCSSGIAPTTSERAPSQVIATRRAPTRSMIGPPSTLSTTSGSISASATRPVFSGLPVVVSTKHGSAIIETRVPMSEIALGGQPAVERPRSRRHRRRPPGQRERLEHDRVRHAVGVVGGSSSAVLELLDQVRDGSISRSRLLRVEPAAPVAERRGVAPLLGAAVERSSRPAGASGCRRTATVCR